MKLILRIFNIILIAISAVAIGFVALTPLMQMNVDYTVETSDLMNVFKGKLGSGEDSISDEELEQIIVEQTHGDGIKFSLSLKLESKGMKKMRDASTDERLNAIRDEVFTPVIKQVIDNEEIKGVVNKLAETMAKKMARKTLREQIISNLVQGDDKENPEFLNNAGITDQFLDGQTQSIYDALTGQNGKEPSISNVADSIVDVLINIEEQFQSAPGSEYDEYREGGSKYMDEEEIRDLKEDIKTQLNDMLVENNLADSEGHILSTDEALALIIQQMLEQANSSSSSSGEEEHTEEPSLVLAHYEEVKSEEEKTEENRKTLGEVISEAAWKVINDNVFKDDSTKATIADAVGLVSKYGVIVQYVFMGMWGVLAIFALIKIFARKKPYVYMGFFWWLAIIIFGLVEAVFGAFLFAKPILTALKGTISLPEQLMGLEFSLYSNLSVCWICNTVLFFFSIAYAIIAHKAKVNYKVEKRAQKAAKAA